VVVHLAHLIRSKITMKKPRPPQGPQIILGNWIITQRKERSWKVHERAGDHVFSIRSLGASQWQISAGSSVGLRRRPLVAALNLEEAVLAAARILYPADYVTNDHPHLDLAEAFDLAIKQSYAGAEGKALLYRNAGFFVEWADKRDIRLWEQVRLDVVHEYAQYLIGKGLAAKTIKGYLEPIKAAGKRVLAVYPDHYRDPCYAFRLPRRIGAPKTVAEKVGRRGLTIREVIQLADYLSTDKYAECLVPTVLMCGLLGCHVREVVYLTWDKLDLKAGILKVEEEIGHEAKTPECVRLIPLPKFLVDRLKEVPRNGDRVITLVSERRGRPKSSRPDNLIGQRYSDRAIKWKPERYVPLSDLRNTLINVARRNPVWSERLTEQYVGHADPSVSGKHYQSTDPIELFDLFQNGIIPLLNSEIEKALEGTKWQQNGRNPEGLAPGFGAQIIEIGAVS
jgi:integrase